MDSPAASGLCENCRVLEFDDSAKGGSQAVDDEGNIYLRMPSSAETSWEVLLDEDNGGIHDGLPDFPSLASSARQGCGFCALLRTTLLSEELSSYLCNDGFWSQPTESGVQIMRSYIWAPPHENEVVDPTGRGVLTLEVDIHPDSKDVSPVRLSFRVEPKRGQESVANWLRICPFSRIRNRLDPECIAWANSVLDDCSSHHEHAAHSPCNQEPFCPKRLVDVRSEPARLVLGTEVQRHQTSTPKYAALSYCWGPEPQASRQLKTTVESLQERISGITTQQMTPVLRDAVAVTRALSIPFLWIDSLCVLQGRTGTADWEEQSAIMHKIYGHAHVTIGAVASASCTQGFCNPAERETHLRFHSTINPQIIGELKISFLSYIMFNEPFEKDDVLWANIQNSVWSTRAWTYQERVLSTRLLGFGKQDLFFTCPFSSAYHGVRPYPQVIYVQVGLCESSWQTSWSSITNDYSHRLNGLSRSADRLPALSGIASSYCRAKGYRERDYAVGMWKAELFSGLTWELVRERSSGEARLCDLVQKRLLPESSQMPSWSWVSQGKVELGGRANARAECQIEPLIELKGKNPFGEVRSALLRITARVCKLPSDLQKLEGDHRIRAHQTPWLTTAVNGHQWCCWLDWVPTQSPEPAGELRMVFTGSWLPCGGLWRRFFGILVHEVGPARPGVFLRVGTFDSSSYARQPSESGRRFIDSCTVQTVELV